MREPILIVYSLRCLLFIFLMGNQDVQINLLSELASLCWKVFVGDGQPLVAKQPLDEFD